VLLTAAEEDGVRIVERASRSVQHQGIGARVEVGDRRRSGPHRDPLAVERALRGEVDVDAGAGSRVQRHRVDGRPAVVPPVHGRHEGLATERRECAGHAARAHAEQHAQPVAVRPDDEVAGAGVLHGADRGPRGHQGVLRRGLEGALRRVAARDRDAVAALGATLGDHEVPASVDRVQVRRLGELAPGARPDRAGLLEGHVPIEVDPDLLDAEVLAHPLAAQEESRVGDVHRAVVAPGDVGVDPVERARPVVRADQLAVAPGAGGVDRGEVEHPAPHRIRDDQVEHPVAVSDRRSPRAPRGGDVGDRELIVARGHVPDELPVLEVA